MLPGNGSERIRCDIIHPPETQGLKYECISYRAGDPKDILEIEVNGHSFNAFASLGAALRKLRLPDRSRILWADQICINQNEVLERNNQVLKMRTFYENAECVLVWLGALMAGDVAFDALQILRAEYDNKLSNYTRNLQKSYKVMPLDIISIQRSIAEGVLNEMLSDDQNSPKLVPKYEALGNLFRSELWTRLWIWQEIVVARSVCLEWDTHSIDFDDLLVVGRILMRLDEIEWAQPMPKILLYLIGSPPVPNMSPSRLVDILVLHRRRHNWQQRKALHLIDLLDSARPAGSTDPRDKVFALCGLVDPGYNIIPNYSETIVQTYCKTAVSIMEQEQSLDILENCRHPRATDVSRPLPTWCPDWSLKFNVISGRVRLLWDDISSIACRFKASAATRGSFQVREGSLFAQGLPIGAIQSIGTQAEPDEKSFEDKFDSLLNSWSRLLGEHTTVTGELRLKLERTATIDDRGYPNVSIPRNVIDAINYNNLKRDAVNGRRRFFMTGNRLMGMAPPHVEVEGLVVVLLGARVPFLLRKADGFYTLVGEAYVSDHYIVGAAITDMEAGKIQVQDFEIR